MKTQKSPQQFIYVAYEEDNHLSVGIRSKKPFPDSIQDEPNTDYYLYINFKAGCETHEDKAVSLMVEYSDCKWTVIGQGFKEIINDNLGLCVEKMKAEISTEVKAGRIPKTVKDFSELHEYVDANEFGGFCDENYVVSNNYVFENEAQERVNEWIKGGGLLN